MNDDLELKLETFYSQYPLTEYRRGETIIRAGDDPVGIFYIHKGLVRLYAVSPEGKEITLLFYRAKEFFPLTWILSEQPSEYFFEAINQTQLYKCKPQEFRSFLRSHSNVHEWIEEELFVRLRSALQHVELLALYDAKKRVRRTIRMLAKQFGREIGGKILLRLPLIHKDIAVYAGVTRETASLEIESLQKEKILRRKGKYFVIEKMKKLV